MILIPILCAVVYEKTISVAFWETEEWIDEAIAPRRLANKVTKGEKHDREESYEG